MADNITKAQWDAGATAATDDVAGVHYPKGKLVWGANDTANNIEDTTTGALPTKLSATAVVSASTTTPLGIGATYTTPTFDTAVSGHFFTGACIADQDGTYYIEESIDGSTNWTALSQFPYTANEVAELDYAGHMRYVRARFVNGAVAQTIFRASMTQRLAGANDKIGIDPRFNAVIGDKSNNLSSPSATAHEVVGAIAKSTAASYTDGNIAMPRITLAGDTVVTLDGEIPAVSQSGTWNVGLSAGTNNIGDVDVLSLPALPAGTNNIGDVDVLTLPALPAGNNNIGDVDVLTLPALPAGTNNIGDVDVASIVGGATIATNQVTVGSASTLIVAQRTGRRAVLITNHGTVDVYVGVTGLTTGNGFLLKGIAGACVSIPTAAAVYGITGSSQAVSFMEVF